MKNKIKLPKTYDRLSVINLTFAGDNEEFRTLSQLQEVNKYVMKYENKGNYVRNIEDKLIKIDIFIEGMKPIFGVPIEVSGLRSYELTIEGETNNQSKKRKHQFALIVDIHQDGTNKIVSFESQVIFTNSTEFDINIAHVFTNGIKQLKEELNPEEITE